MLIKKLFISLAIVASISSIADARKPKHIIFIGLDGWGSYSMAEADMPHVRELMTQGSWTIKKRSVLPSSSAINWASIFMGTGTEGHGYTEWDSRTPEIPSIAVSEHGIFPTIFTVTRQQMPDAELGALYEWDGIAYLVDTLALDTYRQVAEGPDNNSQPLTDAAVEYIKTQKPLIAAIIYDNPDHVGHSAGHDTPEYYEVLSYLDGQIGQIIEASKQAGIYDDTVFIISADHGGIGKGHGGKTLLEMETPLVMAGPGIKKAGELKSAVMQFDIAPTIAALIGITTPQPWIGRPVTEALGR